MHSRYTGLTSPANSHINFLFITYVCTFFMYEVSVTLNAKDLISTRYLLEVAVAVQ